MTSNDEFDVDLELEDGAADDFAADVDFQEEEMPAEKKKSGGGFFVKFLLFLIMIGGGLFASVKYLDVQVPYLSDMLGAQKPAVTTEAPAQSITATAEVTATTADVGILAADAATQPADVGANIAWADGVADADTSTMGAGDDVAAADIMMEGFPQMSADDQASANTVTGGTENDFGFPPATDDATDLAAVMADDSTATTATPVESGVDVWDDTPATDAGTTLAVDEAGVDRTFDSALATTADANTPDRAATDTPAPVVTDPVPAGDAADTPRAVVASEKEVAALKSEVTTLEKQVADLKKTTVSKTDSAALKAALVALEKAAPADTVKTADSKPAAATKPVAVKPAAPVRKSWVLRSAKPGMAWISEKGSGEIKTIAVGDNVSGIGKVTDITTDASGRWVVSGTRGKINQ